MIGKIINYGTDTLLPEKYKFIGDYSCAIIDGASGDFASAGILVAEGVSENLRQTGNQDAALVADVTGAAVSVASGDINKTIKDGNTETLHKIGLKMGAVGASAGIGKALDDNEGAKVATSIATGSIGKDLHETTIKSGLSAVGIGTGYKLKGKDGILKGASTGSATGNLGINTAEIIQKDSIGLEDVKNIKQNSTTVAKGVRNLSDDEAKSKKEIREKIKEDQMFTIANRSSDAVITTTQLTTEDTENTDEQISKLVSEIGQSGNAVCRIREKKIEGEGRIYKMTDTLCYVSGNYADIKNEVKKKSEK
ncbi:MAG: hypothetical protein N2746_06400 [Deltaproteobacteria bacterium]|nr:hypothetical protein [Deltaproteobacteria bacterium]